MCKTQWGIDEYFLRFPEGNPNFFCCDLQPKWRSLVLLNMQKKQWSFIRQEEDLAKSGYKPEIKYKSLIIFLCLWLLNQNQVYQSGDSDWWVDSRLVQIVESGLSLENSLPVNGIQWNKLFTKTRPHTVSVSLDDQPIQGFCLPGDQPIQGHTRFLLAWMIGHYMSRAFSKEGSQDKAIAESGPTFWECQPPQGIYHEQKPMQITRCMMNGREGSCAHKAT